MFGFESNTGGFTSVSGQIMAEDVADARVRLKAYMIACKAASVGAPIVSLDRDSRGVPTGATADDFMQIGFDLRCINTLVFWDKTAIDEEDEAGT